MAFHDTHLDAPPHPLGIGFHPNWQAVRDRRAERECNLIARQAQEERAAQRRAAASRRIDWDAAVMALQAAVCAGFVACFWWMLL